MKKSLFLSCGPSVSNVVYNPQERSTDQVVVGIPSLGGVQGTKSFESVKHTLRRLGTIVEQEHDPGVNDGGVLSSHDDGRLVIGVVLREVADRLKNLGSLIRGEDIVSSPHLGIVRVEPYFEN